MLQQPPDLAGNPTKVTDVQGPSGAPTETQCYSYNGLAQLTQAWPALAWSLDGGFSLVKGGARVPMGVLELNQTALGSSRGEARSSKI